MGSSAPGARHGALLYEDDESYLGGLVPIVEEGIRDQEPVFIAVPPARLTLLRAELGDSSGVTFADMTQLGANPYRIIPAVHSFISQHANRPVRVIGEPVWPGRREDEIVEVIRHEALVNLAFTHTGALLLCPYDTVRIDASTLEHVERTHPQLRTSVESWVSGGYRNPLEVWAPQSWPLPPPPPGTLVIVHGPPWSLTEVRSLVRQHAEIAHLPADRVDDAVLATNELCTNTIRHTTGGGVLRIWQEPTAFVCEVRDHGYLSDPLAARRTADPSEDHGRGLFLVHQLCDLTQIRSNPNETTIRTRFNRQ